MSLECRAKELHKTANKTITNVVQFRYLGITVRNQKFIQKKIKTVVDSGNACYH
jgi:hypothetical protein